MAAQSGHLPVLLSINCIAGIHVTLSYEFSFTRSSTKSSSEFIEQLYTPSFERKSLNARIESGIIPEFLEALKINTSLQKITVHGRDRSSAGWIDAIFDSMLSKTNIRDLYINLEDDMDKDSKIATLVSSLNLERFSYRGTLKTSTLIEALELNSGLKSINLYIDQLTPDKVFDDLVQYVLARIPRVMLTVSRTDQLDSVARHLTHSVTRILGISERKPVDYTKFAQALAHNSSLLSLHLQGIEHLNERNYMGPIFRAVAANTKLITFETWIYNKYDMLELANMLEHNTTLEDMRIETQNAIKPPFEFINAVARSKLMSFEFHDRFAGDFPLNRLFLKALMRNISLTKLIITGRGDELVDSEFLTQFLCTNNTLERLDIDLFLPIFTEDQKKRIEMANSTLTSTNLIALAPIVTRNRENKDRRHTNLMGSLLYKV